MRSNFFDNTLVTIASFKFCPRFAFTPGVPMGGICEIAICIDQFQKGLLDAGSLDCVPCATDAELLHVVLLYVVGRVAPPGGGCYQP